MPWTQHLGAIHRQGPWLLLIVAVGASCSTSGMHLPNRSPEVSEGQDAASATDPGESIDPVADVKTAEVDAPTPSPLMTASVRGTPSPDVPATEAALISALDDTAHTWFRLLAAADFEGAARMTGGSGTASAIAYWWEAMENERGRLQSLQVLGIEGSESYYTVDVQCDFERGPASRVQLMIRDTNDVVSWRRTAPGAPSTPEGGPATE